jgi:hypothetical protein
MTNPEQTPNDKFRLDVITSTSDFVLIQLQMPSGEFTALKEVLVRPETMDALCRIAVKTGLAKALEGSTFCATCHSDGIQHQFEAKNWVNGFVEALSHCGPGFALQRRKCNPNIGHVEHHD